MTEIQWKELFIKIAIILSTAAVLIFVFGCRTEYYPNGKIKSDGFNLGTQGKGSYGLIVIQVGDELANQISD